MKKRIITLLQYLFFISLGVFFVWLTVKDITAQEWQHIRWSLINSRRWLFFPALIMLLLAHFSRALRWKILMEPLGYSPSTFNVFSVVMIGYLVNAGVPRLGEVVKCTLLSRYEKVRADRLVGTIVVERAMDLICLIIVFILALLFQGQIIGHHVSLLFNKFFQDNTGHFSSTKLLIVLGSILFVVLIIYFLLKRFGHIDIVAKIKNVLIGIVHGLSSIRFIKHKGLFLFHTILIWTLYLLSTTVGIYALRETGDLGIGAGLTTLAVGSVGMIISPGGIGAYPLFVANLIGLYGVDVKTTGMALGWMLWAFQTVVILVGGIIFTILFSFYNKKIVHSANGQQHTE